MAATSSVAPKSAKTAIHKNGHLGTYSIHNFGENVDGAASGFGGSAAMIGNDDTVCAMFAGKACVLSSINSF